MLLDLQQSFLESKICQKFWRTQKVVGKIYLMRFWGFSAVLNMNPLIANP